MDVTYDAGMTLTGSQSTLERAEQAFLEAKMQRDQAIVAAYRGGMSAVDISAEVGLTRQQVHRIVASHPSPELTALRDEVTEELHGVPYGAILPGDTENIDAAVTARANALGITA